MTHLLYTHLWTCILIYPSSPRALGVSSIQKYASHQSTKARGILPSLFWSSASMNETRSDGRWQFPPMNLGTWIPKHKQAQLRLALLRAKPGNPQAQSTEVFWIQVKNSSFTHPVSYLQYQIMPIQFQKCLIWLRNQNSPIGKMMFLWKNDLFPVRCWCEAAVCLWLAKRANLKKSEHQGLLTLEAELACQMALDQNISKLHISYKLHIVTW